MAVELMKLEGNPPPTSWVWPWRRRGEARRGELSKETGSIPEEFNEWEHQQIKVKVEQLCVCPSVRALVEEERDGMVFNLHPFPWHFAPSIIKFNEGILIKSRLQISNAFSY